MTSRAISIILSLTTAIIVAQCDRPEPEQASRASSASLDVSGPPDQFGDYWYQGKAELTSYDLEQSRYGAMHSGTAMNIFVTEDFSRTKQVKLDDPSASPGDAVNVLKLNATRKFNTGIYPYSIMTSVFTPVRRDVDPATLKVTASIQEWCGQTFVQMNREETGYHIRHFSYFEDEGDGDEHIEDPILEDELWNILRLNPDDLPTGSLTIVPSSVHHRLTHSSWRSRQATATLTPSEELEGFTDYRLEYPGIGRQVLIRFRSDFPYQIDYWEETIGAGTDSPRTTRATLRKRMMIDYWTRNRPEDVALRSELGL